MFEKITEAEINERSMANVSTTPNRPTAFGESKMDAQALKLRFDRLGRYLAGRLNEIFTALNEGNFARAVYINHEGQKVNLETFIKNLLTGEVSDIQIQTMDGIVYLTELGNKVQEMYNGQYTGDLAGNITIVDGVTLKKFYEDFLEMEDQEQGEPGKSAYDYAVEGGYQGTEEEFAKKLATEYPSKVSQLENDEEYITASGAPVQTVNGKTGAVELNASDVGARPNTWIPSYSDVNADKAGTAQSLVSGHNTSTDSHNDIRLELQRLAGIIADVLDSDDVTLDEMHEIVAVIKANTTIIEAITTGKVNVTDIIDNLTTNVKDKPLSAAQGVALKTLIDALTTSKLDATELTNAINTALAQAKASGKFDGADGKTPYIQNGYWYINGVNTNVKAKGENGTSVTVSSVSESTESGGSNVVTFSDGKTVTIKNGLDGEGGVQIDDIVLVENGYDEKTAKFNYRLAGNSGVESPYNGSLITDFLKVKYTPDAYALISGIEHLVLNYDMYFSVNYYDADKQPTGTLIMPHTKFGTYDGTLPLSFPIFEPMINAASDVTGIENTEYVRIKLGIALYPTAISASNCQGLTVKVATRSKISPEVVGMPSHWNDEVAQKTEVVKNLQAQGGKSCVTFAFAADTHIPDNASGRTEHIGRVIGRMLDNCQSSFAVLGGDVATRGSRSTENEYFEELAEIPYHLASLWNTDRLLLALGNHDGTYGDGSLGSSYNYSERFNQDKMWSAFFRGQALDYRRVFSENGLYFFVDNITQKTRFIILNSHYAADVNGRVVFANSCYGQEQLDWLADVALDMPEGYGAVIVTHVAPRPVNESTVPYTVDYMQIVGIINAYINRTTFSNSFTSATASWGNSTVNVDFTNAKGEIIAMFAGHEHRDIIDTDTLKCPIINVVAAGAPANGSYTSYNRPFGTGKETSFDMVTINRATKMIYCTRVGAGNDRTVSYGKTYTVTFVADGVTVATVTYNEGATSITEPAVPAKSGYTGVWESYTLNNTDITVNAVYTATGPSYNNLAKPNDTNKTWSGDWVNDARMGSDGAYRSSTNSMVTNTIAVTCGDVLYFANTGFTSKGNGVTSGNQICFFKDSNAATRWYGGTPEEIARSYPITFTYNADGTLASMAFNAPDKETAYMRLCLAKTVDKYQVIIAKKPII